MPQKNFYKRSDAERTTRANAAATARSCCTNATAKLQLKQRELEHKIQMDTQKLQIDAMAKSSNAQIQAERIAAENQREGARLGVRLATDLDKSQREDQKEGAKLGN